MYNYNLEIPVSMESKATVSGKEMPLESDDVIEDAFRKLANEVKGNLDKNANFITDDFELDVFEVSYSGDFDEDEGTLYLDVVIDKPIAEEELENFLDKYCKANITHVEALDEEVITDEDDSIDATVVYRVSLKTFPNLIIVNAEDELIEESINTGNGVDLIKKFNMEIVEPKIMPDGRWVYPKELLDDWEW